jgi:hypothetical protein
MTEYEAIGVDSAALVYLRKCLAQGNQLARLLAALEDLGRGSAKVLIPFAAQPNSSQNYEQALVPEQPRDEQLHWRATDGTKWRAARVPDMTEALADQINEFFASHADGICVLEDAAAREGDPFLTRLSSRLSYGSDGTVFHLLFASDANTARVVTTIREAQSWQLAGCMATSSSDVERESTRVSDGTLAQLAAIAQTIVVRAFDGDGWLIWSAPG